MTETALPPQPTSDAEFADRLQASIRALAEGRHAQGADEAQLAIERAQLQSLPAAELARAFHLLATHQWRLGLFEDAALTARRALVLWQQLADPGPSCETHCLIATAFTELGLYEEALRHAAAAFDLARRHRLPAREIEALNRLGICHERLGDPERGEQYLLSALQQARQVGDEGAEMMALNNLAATGIGAYHLLSQRGENASAHAFLQRSRVHAEAVLLLVDRGADAYRQGVVRGNLGEILSLLGEFDAGETLLQGTIELARERGYRAVELRTRYNLGELRMMQGRHADALTELQATLEGLRQHDHAITRMRVHRALHQSYKALGQFEPALKHFEAYHAMEMQRLSLQARAQARLMVNRQDIDLALASAPAPFASAPMPLQRG
ncbi:tetratricopeptide repeat protein [Aquincola sp. S2]|uniref:Tetratricopeptide repeat protein n=1 Tax=Pseudaquabacterium terrae TaxID=2732868 RepID=A0ABX2ETA3_9BURK|nr:tetratricopeptide repeat protein [Aquabacterium terrae]NRF71896.1 tetratricopeptide repeat protein [Aquabacterium terrae]